MTSPRPPGELPDPRDPEGAREPLNDFPLTPEPPLDIVQTGPTLPHVPAASGFSALPDRALGTAADVATSVLVVLVALLAAFAARGRTPTIRGIGWTALFALTVSFFAVVVPLVLFGRTVGMALAGLVARDDGSGRHMTPSEASRRWAGTLLTLAGMGIPLLWTVRHADSPTPADRFSGRTLVRDG
jgi:RDD family